jgi:hypothetical protein
MIKIPDPGGPKCYGSGTLLHTIYGSEYPIGALPALDWKVGFCIVISWTGNIPVIKKGNIPVIKKSYMLENNFPPLCQELDGFDSAIFWSAGVIWGNDF